MKQLLLLFLFSYSLTSFAQVSLSLSVPDASLEVIGTEDEVIAKGTLTNETADTMRIGWSRNIIELFEGWETAVCDNNLCYAPSINESPQDLVILPGGESQFNVYIYPLGLSGGRAIIEVTATDLSNENNTVTGRYEFNTNVTTSTTSIPTPDIKIFPNPTVDFISITEAQYVERLIIYNIVGRPVKMFEANYNNTYNIVDLPTGMYLVRLMGEDDKTIKTVRLSKKGGA